MRVANGSWLFLVIKEKDRKRERLLSSKKLIVGGEFERNIDVISEE